MKSKKKRRRQDEETALFAAPPPAAPPQSDIAYDTFRRHIEEQVQQETRAFHQLRSAAENKMPGPTARALPAPPREVPRDSIERASARGARAEKPAPARVEASGPRRSLPLSLALYLSLITLGGISWQVVQQLQTRSASDLRSRLPARSRPLKDASAQRSKAPEAPCATAEAPNSQLAAAAPAVSLSAAAPVAAALLAAPASEAAPLASRATEPPAGGLQRALISSGGEVRRGPSTQYEILDVLPLGSSIEGVPTSDRQWLRLEDGKFLALAQLELLDSPVDAPFAERWIAAPTANLRALPSLQASVSRKMNRGQTLRVAPLNKRWGRVEGGGYIFLALTSDSDTRPLRFPLVMRVSAEQATIHTGPGSQYAPVGLYFKNHKVEVVEQKEGWFRIGSEQFIRNQDLEISAQTHQTNNRF